MIENYILYNMLSEVINMNNIYDINIEEIIDILTRDDYEEKITSFFQRWFPRILFDFHFNHLIIKGSFLPVSHKKFDAIIKIYAPFFNHNDGMIGNELMTYDNIKRIALSILSTVYHEITHYEQSKKSKKYNLNYKYGTLDEKKWISYFLQNLEIGAKSFAFAKVHKDENLTFEEILNKNYPNFFPILKKIWTVFNKNEKIWIKKQLSKFKKQYYIQLAELQ